MVNISLAMWVSDWTARNNRALYLCEIFWSRITHICEIEQVSVSKEKVTVHNDLDWLIVHILTIIKQNLTNVFVHEFERIWRDEFVLPKL